MSKQLVYSRLCDTNAPIDPKKANMIRQQVTGNVNSRLDLLDLTEIQNYNGRT